ncbi:hypothetical protein VTK73DRAFT_8411 [Phialemonium thermophilum]|uniref:Uncharacterized protein n=1 Tax=Phialemonium thermophilum TaxID=223376 RepID=A0ABR3W947_9PEZI
MESIQLAQMLADLSDLNAAQEAEAALALVNANKVLSSSNPESDASGEPHERQHRRVGSASAIVSRTASPARFDKLGRRIFTPPLTRANSAQGIVPGSAAGGSSTPQQQHGFHHHHHHNQHDDDVARATSLMQLYEIRAKLRQQDQSSLLKARERINAIQARQQMAAAHMAVEKKEPIDARQSRFSYPKVT